MTGSVLIVDDEIPLAEGLARVLKQAGFQVALAHSVKRARREMHKRYPDVALVDLRLPDGDGCALVNELRDSYPATQFIIITAHGSIRSAVEATKSGAFDYLPKPFEPAEMRVAIDNALRQRKMSDELQLLRNPSSLAGEADEPLKSAAMRQTAFLLQRAAEQDGIVLLLGESGSGKDYWARWIHQHSSRRDGPFFAINCAALSPQLAESELFGHEPGSFTGAHGRKRGLLELADNGTLLLNEIGELEPTLQSKLLTFLDTRTILRVGGERTITVSARLIAATNRNLSTEVERGAFRMDLFYRLNVFPIEIPPLRERLEDLHAFIRETLARLRKDLGLSHQPQVSRDALEALTAYEWPGNVRELRNVLERALILSPEGKITASSLSLRPKRVSDDDWRIKVEFPRGESLHEVTANVARELIIEALRRGKTKQRAAELLGISRHALAHQMKSINLDE